MGLQQSLTVVIKSNAKGDIKYSVLVQFLPICLILQNILSKVDEIIPRECKAFEWDIYELKSTNLGRISQGCNFQVP